MKWIVLSLVTAMYIVAYFAAMEIFLPSSGVSFTKLLMDSLDTFLIGRNLIGATTIFIFLSFYALFRYICLIGAIIFPFVAFGTYIKYKEDEALARRFDEWRNRNEETKF